MSIVHEALKKANSNPPAATRPNAGLGPEIEAGRRKGRSPMVPLFLALFALLIAGPIMAPILTAPSRTAGTQATLPASMSATSSGSNRLGQFALEEAPLPRTSFQQAKPTPAIARPSLDLSGIVYAGTAESSYCLINGQVFRVGDPIGSMRVAQISKDEVILDSEGQRIILAVGDKV